MNKLLQTCFALLASILLLNSAYAAPTVYIPLGSGNLVIAVDAKDDSIIAQYTGVENAHGLVATPDGEYLIAGSLTSKLLKPGQPKDTPNSKLFLIHPGHGHVMSTIPVAGWTHHQAITPDGRYVLSTHGMRGLISVLDMQANKIVREIKTGMVPNYTLVTKDGKYAYVSNSGSNNISEIDLATWKVTRTLESGPAPEHMAFSLDESMIYAVNPRAGTVTAVTVKSGKMARSYKLGANLHSLDITEDGKTLFVSSKQDEKLIAIDIKSGTMRSQRLTPAPYHLNIIKGTNKLYISSRKKPIIWVIDQKTLKVINEIKLPAGEGHQMVTVQ